MSIVDTWDWDKLNVEDFKDEPKMTSDMKVRTFLREFYEHCGIWPNRITMGYYLVNELHDEYFPFKHFKSFEDLRKELEGKVKCEYEGIPIKIDYDNPYNLEVGYMVKWIEEKY